MTKEPRLGKQASQSIRGLFALGAAGGQLAAIEYNWDDEKMG